MLGSLSFLRGLRQALADGVPEADLVPPSGSIERAKLQGVLNFISAELHKSFSPLFSATASEEQIQAAPAKVGKCFDYIEARFSDSRTHIMGDTYTIADAYLFVVARWAGFKDISLDAWPKLQAYLQRIGDRPAVKAAIEAETSG